MLMPEFSERISPEEEKRLCSLATKTFREFRDSQGTSNSLDNLAFVFFNESSFGKHVDSVFFDNSGVYILRETNGKVTYAKKPDINDFGISLPLSDEDKGFLYGSYMRYADTDYDLLNGPLRDAQREEFYKNAFGQRE